MFIYIYINFVCWKFNFLFAEFAYQIEESQENANGTSHAQGGAASSSQGGEAEAGNAASSSQGGEAEAEKDSSKKKDKKKQKVKNPKKSQWSQRKGKKF